MDPKQRQIIISAFGKSIGIRPYPFGKEADLPFPKTAIRQALAEEILMGAYNEKSGNFLEGAFGELETFLSDKEFDQVKPYAEFFEKTKEFKITDPIQLSKKIQELCPNLSVGIDISKMINSRMNKRLEQIKAMKILLDIWKE